MRRVGWLLVLAACGGDPSGDPFGDGDAGTPLFDVAGGFWDAPFPSDHRVREDTRRVDVSGFPAPEGAPLVGQLKALLDDGIQGWSLTAAIYVPVDRGVAPGRLPSLEGSVEAGASVFLMDVDPDSPDRGRLHPIEVAARDLADGLGPAHAIVALPLPGRPLAPRTRYALIVKRDVFDVDQHGLTPPPALEALFAGEEPDGWRPDVRDQYLDAVAVLAEEGVDLGHVAGLTVFTTSAPTRELGRVATAARGLGGLRILATPAIKSTEHPDYCVFEGSFDVPNFQSGAAPFATEGGTFTFDVDRSPLAFADAGCGGTLREGRACGRFTVTIPRNAGLPDRFPTVVFARTGFDTDRPLLDRGPRSTAGVDVPGTGLAGLFARAGYAAVQLDAPLVGVQRNPAGTDEATLIFNVDNPGAMRDTLRQTALELSLIPEMVEKLYLPARACPGLPDVVSQQYVQLAGDDLVLFAHGTAGSVAPIAAAMQRRYRALVLSGAGASVLETVLHREAPFPLLPRVAERAGLDVAALDRFHPVTNLLQWAEEPADAAVYAAGIDDSDPEDVPHVLMVQGLVDAETPARSANALTLALGLDLVGDALDVTLAPSSPSIVDRLVWTGGRQLPLPGGLNQGAGPERNVTRALVQHEQDGVEDGHEVVFQTSWARQQVSCFVKGMATDQPLVAPLGDEGAPCPLPPETDEE